MERLLWLRLVEAMESLLSRRLVEMEILLRLRLVETVESLL